MPRNYSQITVLLAIAATMLFASSCGILNSANQATSENSGNAVPVVVSPVPADPNIDPGTLNQDDPTGYWTDERMQNATPFPIPIADEPITSFRGTLVGDNATIGAIIARLEWENSIQGFALSTTEAPFGITINQGEICEGDTCRMVDADAESNRLNAATILALVDNAEWVEIHSPIHPCPAPPTVCNFEYRYQRADLADEITAIQGSWNN